MKDHIMMPLVSRFSPCLCVSVLEVLWILLLTPGPTSLVAVQQRAEPEISTQEKESEFTIQARSNEVPVLVVVRDAQGKEVGGLTKEDFRLFDNGKLQVIGQFSVQLAHPAPTTGGDQRSSPPAGVTAPAEIPAGAAAPDRFAALYFDDTYMSFENITRTRDAGRHYLESSVTAADRVGLYTSSGVGNVEFTSDRGKLEDALANLRPHPSGGNEVSECPGITPYEAYLIVDREDPQALTVAKDRVTACMCPPPIPNAPPALKLNPCTFDPQMMAQSKARETWERAQFAQQQTLRGLEELVRRLSALPGQRSIVWISPGFLAMDQSPEVATLIDRALRARVVINAFDSRGLWTLDTFDATGKGPLSGDTAAMETQFAQAAQALLNGVLATAASATGGVFIHDTNDYDGAFRRAGSLPEVAYLLSFSPVDLKSDGKYHSLKVELVNPRGLLLQARKGYFAPKAAPNSEHQAQSDLQEAVFAREEKNDLGLQIHTQFFVSSPTDADLSVTARVDLHQVQLRREQQRNVGSIRFVTALFDQDGNYLEGKERSVELRLADATLKRLLAGGFASRWHFKVRPGTYSIREVVEDDSSGEIAALNGSVEIPEPK